MERPTKDVFNDFSASMLAKTDAWQSLISENIKLTGPLAETIGKQDFININKPFFASIVDHEIHELIEVDNYIITQVSTTVSTPTGASATLEVSEWYEIKNGLIESLRVYFDPTVLSA